MSVCNRSVTVRHWLPIVTICPVNNLPGLIYISVEFKGPELNELYAVRRKIKRLASWRKEFMENIALDVFNAFPTASRVTLRLALDRHTIAMYRGRNG